MKNQTYVIFALLFIIIISVFSVLNVGVVEVNYLFWKGESPLVFVILFSVLLGGVLTTAFGAGKFFSLRRENKAFKRKINHLEKTIAQQTEAEINKEVGLADDSIDREENDEQID